MVNWIRAQRDNKTGFEYPKGSYRLSQSDTSMLQQNNTRLVTHSETSDHSRLGVSYLHCPT